MAESERRTIRIDSAVLAAIGDGARRARLRNLRYGERRKAQRDAQRVKITLDTQPDLVARLHRAATKSECTMSSLANALLDVALEMLERDEIDLEMRPSRSPRFAWVAVEGKRRR